MKFLARHITNQIKKVLIHLQEEIYKIFPWNIEQLIFGIKEKLIILTHAVYFCIATNIPQRLKTGFVLQGHIYNVQFI